MGNHHTQDSTSVLEKVYIETKSLYQVVILNDSSTHIDFVISLLRDIFNKSDREATAITMAVHNTGQAVVGTYDEEIAVTKQHESMSVAKDNGFLDFTVEVKEL